MRGFGGFAVRGEFAVGRREAHENFFFLLRIAGGEGEGMSVITAD
jgi:hypothetical protein